MKTIKKHMIAAGCLSMLFAGASQAQSGLYVGIGIGESELDADVRYGGSIGTPSGSQPPFAFGSDSTTAIEFRLGAEYSITKQLGVFLEYTDTTVDDITFPRIGLGPSGLATTQHSDDVDAINLSLIFKF